jgi:amidohydrolase
MQQVQNALWEWEEGIDEQLFEIRRHLHRFPELSFQEVKTSQYIGSKLDEWGIPYRNICGTGIVVDIWGEAGDGPKVALRADIDALPIEEQSGLPFSSKHPGVMHACGHDGHTTILLGAVFHLWKYKSGLPGMVRCIFQPGEEADGAAQRMIEEGVLEDPLIEVMVALHLWPHLPFGSVGVREGAVTASCDDFVIEIQGKGGHGARPHHAIDAIAIGAEVIRSLQFLAAKGNNPVEPLVIHVGKIYGGSASNVVADRVTLEGTVRAASYDTRTEIKAKLLSLVKGTAELYGGIARIVYRDGNPPVINDAVVKEIVEKSAGDIIGEEHIHPLPAPSMGADDFGFFAEKVPSTYFRLGIRKFGEGTYDLHHPKFMFDETIIPIGSKIFTQFVFNWMQRGE